MADREGGGSSWIAFLAGIILVAIVAVGIIAYSGGLQPRQEAAELEIETPNINPPDVELNAPDVDLPSPPPAPTTPPSAEPAAPAESTTP